MAKILFFCEDAFGPDFFKSLIKDLKEKEVIQREFRSKFIHRNALCNFSINRQIRASEISTTFDKIFLIVDGDGNIDQNKRLTEVHVEEDYKSRVKIIIIETEIEEWICNSLRYKINEKPSKVLKHNLGYKKRMLPKMISKLDYDYLLSESRSFREFVIAIRTLEDSNNE